MADIEIKTICLNKKKKKHAYKFERMVDYYDKLQLFRSNDRGY